MSDHITIYTLTYPYDGATEHTFLGRELPYLAQYFEKVVLVPKRRRGSRLPIPDKVEVQEGFAAIIEQTSHFGVLKKALTSSHFYQEIVSKPLLLLSPHKMFKLLKMSGRAALTKEWVMGNLKSSHPEPTERLLYSYWFDEIAVGIGLAKQEFPDLRFVSRAHGYDIYEERDPPFYWPFRKRTLKTLDKLFLASDAGLNYMQDGHPEFLSRYKTHCLGVEDPGFVSSPSKDGVFRIVSCARLIPLKRIDLLLAGIETAAQLRPELEFEWHHFGDGPMRSNLQAAAKKFPRNVKVYLPGYVKNEKILGHYRDFSVDVFVSVSESEGLPVSIMEAASCGIPIVATNVGGTPEIVSEKNGILLNSNPTPTEIAETLLKLCDHPEMSDKLRKGSRQVWSKCFDAKANYNAFGKFLKQIT